MQRESVLQSLLVATCLCIVCSVLVSTAAVVLKPFQEANKIRQKQREVLKLAGLYVPGEPVDEQFGQVEAKVVDLETGRFVDADSLDPAAYDPQQATRDAELSVDIPEDQDLAKIRRREKYASVYLVHDNQGQLQQLILPVRGKGLWSTMYGFLSLEADCRTVRGITFYEHGETPGLGGEIESEKFRRQWKGKMVRDTDGTPHFSVERGAVSEGDPDAAHKIDGISGATITSRGVGDMVRFWMGPEGYQPLLDRLASEQVAESRQVERSGELVVGAGKRPE